MDRPQEPQQRLTVSHPELVSGSIGGSESKSKRFRNKFGMTRTKTVPKNEKILCGCDHKKTGTTTNKKREKKIINNQKGEKKKKMKLKNIIQIGSFVVAGVAPVSASASDYMCLACPAGTYSNGGSTSCTPCPAGKYAPAASTECKTCPLGSYSAKGADSCTKCSDGTYSNGARTVCVDLEPMYFNSVASLKGKIGGDSCSNVTLYPDRLYVVYLQGGDGARYSDDCSDGCTWYDGGSGGVVEYQFTVNKQTSAQLCAGTDTRKYWGEAPGGGAWIKIGDRYIIAGGGYSSAPDGNRIGSGKKIDSTSLFGGYTCLGTIGGGGTCLNSHDSNSHIYNYLRGCVPSRHVGCAYTSGEVYASLLWFDYEGMINVK